MGKRLYHRYRELGFVKKAIRIGENLLIQDPRDVETRNSLVVLYFRANRKKEAWSKISGQNNRVPASKNEFENIRVQLKEEFSKK